MRCPMPDSSPEPKATKLASSIQILGTTATALDQVHHISGAWQFQLLGNVDVILDYLEKHLPPAEMVIVRTMADETIKRQLRRQMGRIRCVERALKEINTIASKE